MGRFDRSSPVYSIGIVQKLTGLSGRQIRYYEEQGLIAPSRTKGNQRIYSPAEVDLLIRIKSLLEQGYNIEGVKRVLESGLEPSQTGEQKPSDSTRRIDHESILDYLRHSNKLTSLYPVNNRGELEKILRDLSK